MESLKKAFYKGKNFASGNVKYNDAKIILLILPVFHLLISMIIQNRLGYFFLGITDPEYFHLLSGVAMGKLHLDTGYIDHPGTPIQIIIAIASEIVYLFSNDSNIYYDVVKNPELYIFASNLLFNIFLMFTMVYIGRKITRLTNNINAGLLFQLGFFISIGIIKVTARMIPEGFMLLPLSFLMVLQIRYIYDDNFFKKQKKYLISFSLIIGWGIATKLSFAPFIIIPVVILSGLRNKILVIIYSIVAFFLIAFPVLSHLNYFWSWVSNMIIHTGRWGTGKIGFMNLSAFLSRFTLLWQYNKILFTLITILFTQSIFILVLQGKKKYYTKYLKVSFSSIISVLLLAFLICKHFALYYFIPAIIFDTFFMFLIIFPYIKLFTHAKVSRYLYFGGMTIAFLLMLVSFNGFSKKNFVPINKQEKHICTFRSKVKNGSILIISGYYAGTPFKEFSLANGVLLAGPDKKLYDSALLKTYPYSYFYYDWTDKFFHWAKYVDSRSIIEKHKPIEIYIGRKKENNLKIIVDRFKKENPDYDFTVIPIIDNKQFKDKLYDLGFTKKDKS